MSPVRIVIVVLIAAAASIGIGLVVRMLSAPPAQPVALPVEREAPPPPQIETEQVLIATRAMRRGEPLSPEDLTWLEWPRTAVDQSFLTQANNPDIIQELAGSVVRNGVTAFEPLTMTKLVSLGDRSYMAARLSPGMQAAAIEISAESASAGFILPDDRVDVLLTHDYQLTSDDEGEESRVATLTIIRNARVLAIDQGYDPGDGVGTRLGSVATLELSAEAAELLTLGERIGELSLNLRSLADAQLVGETVIAREELLQFYADPYRAGLSTVTVYRNGTPSVTSGDLQ